MGASELRRGVRRRNHLSWLSAAADRRSGRQYLCRSRRLGHHLRRRSRLRGRPPHDSDCALRRHVWTVGLVEEESAPGNDRARMAGLLRRDRLQSSGKIRTAPLTPIRVFAEIPSPAERHGPGVAPSLRRDRWIESDAADFLSSRNFFWVTKVLACPPRGWCGCALRTHVLFVRLFMQAMKPAWRQRFSHRRPIIVSTFASL